MDPKVGIPSGAAGTLDSLALDGILGLAETGGVDDTEGIAAQTGALLDRITGRSGDLADDRPLHTEHSVEEARFSGIGSPAKSKRDPLTE